MKKILLFISFLFIQKSHCADIPDKLINATHCYLTDKASVMLSTDSKLMSFINNKLIDLTKTGACSGLKSVCTMLKNPYILLIKSQCLSMAYVICMNSCEHLTPLVSTLVSEKSITSLLKYISDSSDQGLLYGLGESLYTDKSLMKTETRKALGNTATVIVCLDFVCQSCGFNYLPAFASPLLTGIATSSVMDIAQEKEKSENLLSKACDVAKKPIVMGTIIATGLALGTYACSVVCNSDIDLSVQNIISTVEQGVLYSYGYKVGLNCLSTAFNLVSRVKNRGLQFLKWK